MLTDLLLDLCCCHISMFHDVHPFEQDNVTWLKAWDAWADGSVFQKTQFARWSGVGCRVWSEHTLRNQTFLSEKLSLPVLSLKVPQIRFRFSRESSVYSRSWWQRLFALPFHTNFSQAEARNVTIPRLMLWCHAVGQNCRMESAVHK